MKRLSLVFCVVIMTSCNYFESKKITTQEILNDELQTFNWNDVDEYPTFASCDTTSGKVNKKICFESTLRSILNSKLSNQHIIVTEDINDTIKMKITISKTGVFTVDAIEIKELTQQQIPQLDSLLLHSFDTLPKIYPAIKRSQQVATQFNFPVVVNIN